MLNLLPAQRITETHPLTFTASTDPNGDLLSFGLLGAPAGATIDSSGHFTWIPTEQQGPGVYTATVVVSDTGTPVLSASRQVALTVTEQNTAPVLASIPAQSIMALRPLTVTVSATDSDLPTQTLRYGLVVYANRGHYRQQRALCVDTERGTGCPDVHDDCGRP
ncbi:MAG: putative Ig domain-containing protein [Caldilineaceae bacterium]